MKSVVVLCVAIISCSTVSHGYFRLRNRPQKVHQFHGDAGEPLILTPFIEANKIAEAQAAAQVILPGAEDIKSYSGFLTVNEAYSSNLYFWFFESENHSSTDPVILWLQGGPGSSSLFGLFAENGPFYVDSDLKLVKREHAWTNSHSVLYIDNPVGTGFSFTNNGYADNQTQVGKELYSGLIQFFKLFPQFQKNDFFITGESYAGKYIPAISYTILQNNPTADLKINLQGMAIGNGLTDPITQAPNYANYLYQIGFIDINDREAYRAAEKQCVEAIENEDWLTATDIFFQLSSGIPNVYNYLMDEDPTNYLEQYYSEFINQESVRRALHVGSLHYGGAESGDHLYEDITKSVKPWMSVLLSHYRALIYTGQVDVIVAYPLTLNYLQHLEFSSAATYKTARRHDYVVGKDLAGFYKVAGNLTELLIRDAGHMVPYDQPVWSLDMITKFTRNQSL